MNLPTRKVLLIGWDAADWKVIRPLIASGKMPNIAGLISGGASGQIATLHPPLSPMLWTSIATGKRPFKHGIHGFSEPTPDGLGVQPVTNLSRTSKALWNILSQNALRSIVTGWWPSHPAEPIVGVMVSDHYADAHGSLEAGWPLAPHAVHPPELAAMLSKLRVHPDQVTPAMVEPFVPLANEIDQDHDKRLGGLMRTLAHMMSIDSAAVWLMKNQPWDLFAVYYDAIDHFSHGFMKYHPPRQSWIAERDFELYQNVVSMAYQSQDRSLGILLDKAGEDTTVILLSDHGFHPDHLRPATIPDIPAGPAIEHSDFGILVVSGPGVRKAEVLHGVSLLDVAPTILTLYGLPIGEDMDGKVVSQAFIDPPELTYVSSWEEVPGRDGRHPPHTRQDPTASHEALERMIALGYIEKPDADRKLAVEHTVRELRSNLGEAYQDADRHSEAYAIFAELCARYPDEQRFIVRLFLSCQALGRVEEMRRIVEELSARHGNPLISEYLRAQVLSADKRFVEALGALETVREARVQRADLYMRLRRWEDARKAYRGALEVDSDNVNAHLGLCRIALGQKKFEVAAKSALDALQRVRHLATGHYLLGRALTGMREYARAAEAFRAAILINPNFPQAHLRLAALLRKYLNDPECASEHRCLARQMKAPTEPVISAPPASDHPRLELHSLTCKMPPLKESLVVVTGLPRSGTSMLMQMLAAGGLPVVSDAKRAPDEDNPRGYLEFEPVKNLIKDSTWLLQARGKAVKIVAPLLTALPLGLPCRVILCERNLEEVLDSQEQMLVRRNAPIDRGPERRRMLKEEYMRMLGRVNAMLVRRSETEVLVVHYAKALSDALGTAEKVSRFLSGGLDTVSMAAQVDPNLHRNRHRL